MTDKTFTRRGFIGATAVAIPVTAIFASRTAAAQAQQLPKLDPNEPAAKALQYIADATKIDKAKSPMFKAGSDCANCVQIKAATGDYRPCGAFPGKLVAAKGWCMAWALKPA